MSDVVASGCCYSLFALVVRAFGEDGPGDPRQFIGQRTGDHVGMPPHQQATNPGAQAIGAPLDLQHDGACALHQQSPQILVTALADAQQRWLAAGTVLARDEPDRSRELACASELPGIAQFHCEHAGRDRADARNLQQPQAALILSKLPDQFALDLPDLLIQVFEMRLQTLKQRDHARPVQLAAGE